MLLQKDVNTTKVKPAVAKFNKATVFDGYSFPSSLVH